MGLFSFTAKIVILAGDGFSFINVRDAHASRLKIKLDGLTRDELRYILDPQEVYGPDFPGETFQVLKDKEFRIRLILSGKPCRKKKGRH